MSKRSGCGLVAAGVSLGWIAGLSVSPVVREIVVSLMSFAIAVTAVLCGIQLSKDKNDNSSLFLPGVPAAASVTLAPLAFLIIGVAIGTSAGLIARSRNWLGTSQQQDYARWQETLGDSGDTELNRILLEHLLKDDHSKGVLFATGNQDECQRLRNTPAADLYNEMIASKSARIRSYAKASGDHPESLKAAVDHLLCPDNSESHH